jgi:hypothetical protein
MFLSLFNTIPCLYRLQSVEREAIVKNSATPVGYSGWAALRKEHCDMMPESQNS